MPERIPPYVFRGYMALWVLTMILQLVIVVGVGVALLLGGLAWLSGLAW